MINLEHADLLLSLLERGNSKILSMEVRWKRLCRIFSILLMSCIFFLLPDTRQEARVVFAEKFPTQ